MTQCYRFLKIAPGAHGPKGSTGQPGLVSCNVVPGAGLEPARTLPDPRDFKSSKYYPYQEPRCRKVLYQRKLSAGMASFCFLLLLSLVTAIVTVKRQSKPHKK